MVRKSCLQIEHLDYVAHRKSKYDQANRNGSLPGA
jgi:hypothetical protein